MTCQNQKKSHFGLGVARDVRPEGTTDEGLSVVGGDEYEQDHLEREGEGESGPEQPQLAQRRRDDDGLGGALAERVEDDAAAVADRVQREEGE